MQKANYPPESLQMAISAVRQNHLKLRAAAREFSIPKSTLSDKLRDRTATISVRMGYNPILTGEEEVALVHYVEYMANQGFPVTRAILRCYVREIVRRSGRNPNLNAENGPSDKWFRKLLKRHPQLSERTPENLDKARQRISTQKTADEWFHFLRGVLEKYAVTNKPAQIFNVDESGWSGKEKAKTRVIAPRSGHVFRNKVMTNDHVTANLCISADGKFLPTMIIFQGALPHRAYQDGIPDDWLFGVSESGYMDGNLFVSWFQEIFVPNCGRERPVVLILDNHDSHVTLPLVEAAISNDVVLVGLPGHTTHFLQPLDVKVIGPLKARFATMANNLGFASSQMVIGKAKFPVVLKYAIDQATPASIQEAFAVTGIQPFNPQAIDASQLVPPSFEAKSTEELPAATQITCHACGSFLVNPLVSQGLIPEAMARRPHAPADETSNRKKETSRVRGARFNWGRNAAPAEATPCSPLSYPGVVYAEEPSCSRRVGPSPGYDCTITALPGYILRDHGQSTVVSCNDGAGWDEIIPACVTDTTEQCSLGTEPVGDGTCRLCDVGSYRSANYSSCVGCPPSSTSTYVTGATSSNDCYGLCGLGLYSATGLSPCSACPRGTFWQDSQTCAQCDQQPGLTGYTTGGVGATRISQCVPPETFRVACPRGTKRDVSSCVKCPIGEYQDQEDRTLCNTCGNGRSTYFQGATSFSMCFLECEAGFYSTTGLSPCTPCGVGRYSLNSTTYENCGAGQTTRTNTAGSINECIDQCPAGQFSYGGYDFGGACRNCPANYYQDTVRQTSCKRCSTTTEYSASSGLTSSAQCLDAVTNLCYTGRCQNGGQCVIRDNTYVCNCEIGYYGRTCEVQVRYCDSQPCYHGGVCTETRQGHSCDCLGLATGTNCEDLIKTCISGKSETCKNGADCLNRPGNTECLCRQGFSGNTCLNFQNICSPNPCQNSGSCSDVSFGDNLRRKCTCHPGFTGRNCETNIDNCAADDTCLYGGDCTDHISYYFCQCLPGYGGMYCQNRADPCLGVSCGGGGFCNDDFTQDLPRCICQPGYHYGAYVQYSIQKELAPSDFGNSNGFLATVDDCREQCTSDNQCDRFTYDVLTSMCYTWNKNDNLDMIFYTNYNTYTKDTVYPDDDFYSLWYNLDTPANNLGNNDNEDRSSLNSQFGLHICGGTEPLDAECQRVDGLANQAGITCDTNGLACDLGLTLCVDYKVRFKCAAHRVFLDNICTAKTDYCVDQPCENNGFCSNLAGAGYSCTCPSGYTGQNCQTNINDCENSPCENGGTCTDGVDTFTCDCPPQWTGTQCHVHVNYCQVNLVTCNNHGICRGPQDLATHVCDCYPGYMGDDCQTEINRCESSPCIHDGTCVTLFNSYRCYCVPGFGGTNCEHTVDNCLVDGLFCMNPATCHTIFDNYYCECPANIFGDNCEHQPNPCGSYNKCLNGGDCDILASTSMECGCPGKYSGDGCQTLVDHCGLTNYCKNDGQCSVADTTSGYTCQCAQGFENTDCDTLTNNCIPGACPGGTCYNDVSKSYCRCPLGKTGTNCMRDFDRNYDLFFNHPYGLAFAWIPVWTLLENVNAAAVSLWVRYTENGGTGIYHTMFLGDDLQDSDRFMEFMHDGIVVYIGNGNTEKLLYTHNFVLNDGNWHNVVFNYDMTTGTVYLVADSISHTQIQNNNIIFPDNTYKFWTVLGCQFDQIAHQCVEGGNNFHGLLSQVNWYHRLLHRIDDIPRLLYISQRQMIFSEDTGLSDVTIVWNEYQLESGVSRNIPSEAGPLICDDPGRTLMPGIPDSLPPCTAFVARHRPRLDMINGCPDDIVVYSATRITSVSWQEPVFHDVVDMIRPEYQSGGVFHWGMYSIVYIAVGANENTAVCHFTIYVQSSQCQSPPDPVGGSQTTVDNNPIDYKGSDIYCYGNNYKTDRHAPKLFTCDLTGSWNIKKQFNKFRYPSCGLIKNTARVRIELSVAYYISTQACHATKTNAISRTQQALKAMQLETNNDLCGDIECSDAVITVNCSSPLRRRKRQTDPVVALLEVIIPSAAESFSWGGEQLTMEQYATYKVLGANVLDFSSSIPQGAIDPSTFTITATVICPTGQVYLDGDCVECGAGNYYTTSVSGVEETLCHDCPLATYQDELGTTACKACGVGMTTEMTGSYEPTACKKKCAAGWYFDNDVGDCVACEIGYYQEREGQFYCDFCLSGETTSNTGSTSPNDCKPTPVVSPFTLTLHILDIDFSLLLLNPDSFLYVEHKKNVIDNMMAVLDNILGFHSIELLGFRQANSVYADFVIYVNQSGSVQGTIDALQEVVSRGWINDLSVDSGYFITSTQRGYIMVEEITQWPAKLYKGTDSELIITCNILTIGYLGAEDFTYWWTYNGIVLQPKSTSRFTLSTSTLDIPQQKQSRLKLTPLRSYDSGTYACFVSHKASGAEAGRNITLGVISQPVVTLTPGSLTVNEGADVALECKVIHPLDRQFEFRWYRNGEVLQSRAGETFIPDETSVQLLITAITETTKFGCEAENEAGNGTRATSYIGVIPATVDPEEPTACNVALDYRGREWPITAVDTFAEQDCPSQTLGTVMRSCKQNGEWATANYNCVQETIRTIQQQINQAQDGLGSANLTSSLGDLAHATDIDELLEGDMLAVIDTLASVAVVAEETITAAGETETETQNFLEVASNLLDEKHKDTWDADIDQGQPGAIDVAQVVESFIKAKVKQLSSSTNESFTKHYNNTNIFCEIGRSNEADTSAYTFPNRGSGLPSWIEDTTTALYIPAESFSGMAREYSSQVYRNLPDIVVKKLQTNGQIQDSGSMDINSDVTIAFQSQQPVTNLDPPARITFQHSSPNYSRPICVFWDFGETTWSSQGCEMVSTSETHTVCACDHFTNFAVLMSPGKTPGADQLALSIISAIGCGVSLLCLVCTVAAHLRVWRLVKSDRSTLLMHLCVALIVAYVVFLAGINRAENKDVCTAIAALLHYFWLVVFFLMLAEGIEIAVSVTYVFVTKSRVKWLVPLAWGLPAVIVGVSLGVSRLDGYGTDTFCWLSTESGLLWAFVGPAAFVILVNFIIIIVVFRKMFKTSAMLAKTDKDKAKTGVRSLCVLLPVLGLSWVFGIFSVNEDLVAFQYIFAICNALQGFFIFLFHCCFNRQVKDAWKQIQIRKKSLASYEDSYKKQSSSVTGTTTYYSADGSRKQSNDKQADRQMQDLAKKEKRGSSNIFNTTPNNKLDNDKKPNVDAALEDVKISNILCESDKMGEAAGISSILNTPDKQPESDRATTRTEEGCGISRETHQSSRKYDYIDTSRMETFGTPQPKPPGYEQLLSPQRQTQSRPYDNLTDGGDQGLAGRVNLRDKPDGRRVGDRPRSYELDARRNDPPRDYEAVAQQERSTPRGYEPSSRPDDTRGRREESNYMKGSGKSSYKHSRSSRSDEDIEGSHRSQDISEALPTRYKPTQMKAKLQQPEPTRQTGPKTFGTSKEAAQAKKNMAKKKYPKDRSQVYQYPYDVNYLGPQSRHSSLENMSSNYGYSPYSGMQSGPGHSGSRPAHQTPSQWDQYGQYGRTRPQQRRGDYW